MDEMDNADDINNLISQYPEPIRQATLKNDLSNLTSR